MAAPIVRKRRKSPVVGPVLARIYSASNEQVFRLLAEHAVGPARPISCERCGTRQHTILDSRGALRARFRSVDFHVTMTSAPIRLRPRRGRVTVKCRVCRHLTRLPV